MNHKKKILFLVTQSEFGGAQRFIYTLINNLEANKYDILVGAGPEGDDENGLLSALEKKRINTKHLKYLRRGVNPFFDYRALTEIRNLVKQETPDILFLCSSKAGLIGSLAGYQLGIKKIIYRIGGWAFNDPWPIWKKKLYLWLEKWSAKFKNIIINNAESDRVQAIKLGIKPRKKILTIYNGIDVYSLKFLSKEEARRKIFNFQFSIFNKFSIDNFQLIGTVANLYPSKGIEHLIKAARITVNNEQGTTNSKFVVIGEGREREKLESLIRKYKLEKNFFLLGAIPNAYKYLKAFDVFVLPSVKEGFPWTILEAMAAGVPVVVTKVGAVPEVIEHNKTGILVKPRDPKGLAKGIKKLLRDKNLREKFARETKKTAKEKFTLKQMVKKYEDLFFIN